MYRKKGIFKTLLASCLLIVAVAACSSGAAVSQTTAAPVSTPVVVTTAGPQSSVGPASVVAMETEGLPAAGQETEAAQAASVKLNLNTATEAGFLTIPGMGNRMVREFMEYRPYVSIEQFRREIGKYVDVSQVAEYEKYVYVPISVNESDAATLQQIPGLDAAEAQALIDARPYASNDAFLTALARYVSDDERAVAQAYLNSL